MTRTGRVLLNDTLNLIQLARETARLQGKQAQANSLKPVVEGLRDLVAGAASTQAAGSVSKPNAQAPVSRPAAVSAEMAQSDFRTLLAAASRPAPTAAGETSQDRKAASRPSPTPAGAPSRDRNMIIQAMAAGGMTDLDIARQMGMTREEVGLIVRLRNMKG
jgi:hypothetical protein